MTCDVEGHKFEWKGGGTNKWIGCGICHDIPTSEHILTLVKRAEKRKIKSRRRRRNKK